MTLRLILGDWLYWPIVVAVIAGSAAMTINFVTVIYTELWA